MLADKIIKGTPLLEEEVLPTLDSVEALYGDLFEGTPPSTLSPIKDGKVSSNIYVPIRTEEILEAKRSWANSAPGPDGITVLQVKRCSEHLLKILFNILLYRRITPSSWKSSRTVLIPKDGDRRDASNWRPITIGSAVQRLLHRVLARRLSAALPLHSAQRGFTNSDGTLANTFVLDHYIKSRRLQGKSYNIVSLDVRKAFDTVSHASIFRGLTRLGVSPCLQDYIRSTLEGAHTTIQVGRAETRRIRFRRGVKQGDPLSPLLFNTVLDELVCALNNEQPGGTLATNRFDNHAAALAFADDLLLLEDREIDMPNAIDRTCQFFKSCGMSLNPRKCHSISAAVVSGKSVPRSRPSFYIQGRPVEALGGPNVFRYLGLSFGSTGSAKPTIYNLAQWLRNLERAPLKPDQKYIVLRSYLVPRLFYGLQSPAITGGILDECDRLVRRSVRKIFHLNVHTGSQFIHARIRDGGLGVTQLRHKIPSIFLSRMENLKSSGDASFSTILSEVGPAHALYHRVRLLAKKGDPDPFWREEISNRPYSVGLQDVVDDASSRSWLQSAPRGWTGRDFVRAIQLRTGNLPTQGLPYKAPEQQRCRAGCPRVESISHVLQGCPVTHAERILRHNEIVDKVAKHARGKGWLVEKEPYVRHQDGQLFKPDLAIHQPEDTLVICDVQVCWEGPRTLAESWNNKKLVYDNLRFRQAAAKHWGNNKHLLFVPLLLGARGVWPRCNAPTTSLLSIPSGVRSSCVHSCLKWGSTLHQHFMSAVWRRRRPDGERALHNIEAHNVVPRELPTERPNSGADHRLPPPSGQG